MENHLLFPTPKQPRREFPKKFAPKLILFNVHLLSSTVPHPRLWTKEADYMRIFLRKYDYNIWKDSVRVIQIFPTGISTEASNPLALKYCFVSDKSEYFNALSFINNLKCYECLADENLRKHLE